MGAVTWTLVVMTMMRAAETQTPLVNVFAQTDPAGNPIPSLCANCRFVRDNVFTQTDGNGTATLSFRCDESEAAGKFCGQVNLDSFSTFDPDPTRSCPSTLLPRQCIANPNKRVSLWGDGRSDPSYVTAQGRADVGLVRQGIFRDWESGDYALFGQNTLYTPVATRPDPALGQPDISARMFYNTLEMLWGDRAYDQWLGADLVSLYTNPNNRLVFYQGKTEAGYDTFWNEYPNGRTEAFKRLLSYLGQHGDVRTVKVRFRVDTDTAMPTAEWNTILARLNTYFTCGFGDCVSGVLSEATVAANNQILHGRVGRSQQVGWSAFINGTVAAPGTVRWWSDTTTAASGKTYIAQYMRLLDWADNTQVSYPMFAFRHLQLSAIADAKFMELVEESADGFTWTLHQQLTFNPGIVNAYTTQNYPLMYATATNLPHACPGSAARFCKVLYTSSPGMRYMRVQRLIFIGEGTVANTALITTFPEYVLSAREKRLIDVHVVPSLPSTVDWTRVCDLTPSCQVYQPPAAYVAAVTAPAAAESTLYGNAVMRAFLRQRLMPVVFEGCQQILPDLVGDFLRFPRLLRDECFRLGANPWELTCFTFGTAAYNSTSPRLVTDVYNTRVDYEASGFRLSIRTSTNVTQVPAPLRAVGAPFTLRDRVTRVYLYETPETNGAFVPEIGLYVSPTSTCLPAPTPVPALPQDPTCACQPWPVHPDVCICADLATAPVGNTTNRFKYKVTRAASTPRVTLQALKFFAVTDVPTNFSVITNRVIGSTQALTTLEVDCRVFLCSNNLECLRQLDSSNYVTFCENQARIVQTTLDDLAGVQNRLGEAVATLRANSLRPVVNLVNIPPLDSAGATVAPAAFNANPIQQAYAQAVSVYAEGVRNVRWPTTVNSSYVGYLLSQPSTFDWQAQSSDFQIGMGPVKFAQKINNLATVQQNTLDQVNAAVANIGVLAENTQAALGVLGNIAATLADSHNALVAQISTNFANINNINNQFTQALANLQIQTQDLAAGINFLDLVGARASTLAVQAAAILAKAVDQAARNREVTRLIKLCTSPRTAIGSLCAGSERAEIISTSVLRRDGLVLLDVLAQVPTRFQTVYTTPEFCTQDTRFVVRDSEYLFALYQGAMVVSPVDLWVPMNLSEARELYTVTPGCPDIAYSVDDLRAVVSVNLLDLTTAVNLVSNLTSYNVSLQRLNTLLNYVNITADLGRLDSLIASLDRVAQTTAALNLPAVLETVTVNLRAMSIAGVSMGSTGVVVSLGVVIYVAYTFGKADAKTVL